MYKNFQTDKYYAMLNTDNGEVMAYEKGPTLNRKTIKTNINKDIPPYPYSDEDILIVEARKH